MKQRFLWIAFASVLVMLFALRSPMHVFTDLLLELGVEKETANESIAYNFLTSSLSFHLTDQIKKMPPTRRAAIVKSLGDYIRNYVESPVFAERYKKEREEHLAFLKVPIATTGPSKEDMIAKFIESLKDDEAGILKELKTLTGAKKAEYEAGLKQVREAMAALQNSRHPLHAKYFKEMKDELMPELREVTYDDPEEAKAAKEAMKNIVEVKDEEVYPPTPKELVIQQLKKFIEISGTVDFNAKTQQQFGVTTFVDKKYEEKSHVWKAMYRSGKEVMVPARAYAQQWLASLK